MNNWMLTWLGWSAIWEWDNHILYLVKKSSYETMLDLVTKNNTIIINKYSII